jgi:hypothetical protein
MKSIFIIVIFISVSACTNKKAEIVDQIRVQQNLIDSIKKESAGELAKHKEQVINFDGKDTMPTSDYKKLAGYDLQIAAASKSIDSLNLELKKY